MDVRFAMPFFHEGRLLCWLQNTGHWPDTGGMTPGGFSAHATEVEQEGLRLPPVKLFKRGEMDREILSIISSNIRVADQRIGDIRAQVSALKIGERRLRDVLDRYGVGTVTEVIAEMKRRAAALMRAKLASVPDGVYDSEAFVDSDGVVNAPLRIALTVTKADGALTFDFSRSSAPCRGPMNSVFATTLSSVYLAVRHVFPDVPLNAGAFAPLHVPRPEGTFLDARYPAPGLGLRRRSLPADRRSGIPRAGAGDPRSGDSGAGWLLGQLRARRHRPQTWLRLCDVSNLRRRLWRQRAA